VRASGLAAHPNHLGLACLLGAAAGACALVAGTAPRWATAVLVVNAGGLTLSGSRSALLGAAVVIACVAGVRSLRPVVGPRVLGVGVAAIVFASTIGVLHAAAFDRVAGDAASDSGHRQRVVLALERIERAPFTGAGFRYLEEAHVVPLQLLAAGGLLT